MNLLYLTFLEDNELYLGVKKKISGQVKAFKNLGYNVSYSMWESDKFYFYGNNNATYNLSSDNRMIKQFCSITKHYLLRYKTDIIYFRVDRLSSDIMSLLSFAKKNKLKVIIEIPNFPYFKDYINGFKFVKGIKNKLSAGTKIILSALDDRISGIRLKGKVDAVILFGNKADSFFGVPAKNFDNGITVEDFEPIEFDETSKQINFITVAGTLWWQGYERVLKGISKYRAENPKSEYKFKFTLVGGDKKEMADFRNLIDSLSLNDCVDCVGFKSGKELNLEYTKANIGISTLGCYKRGLVYCSSLKSREYMALGLPFIYAYEDKMIENKLFAKKYPNDDSIIDMNSIIDFYESIAKDKSVLNDEIKLAKATFDWNVIMKNILDFANQGDK